jgi:hypothetical protein
MHYILKSIVGKVTYTLKDANKENTHLSAWSKLEGDAIIDTHLIRTYFRQQTRILIK